MDKAGRKKSFEIIYTKALSPPGGIEQWKAKIPFPWERCAQTTPGNALKPLNAFKLIHIHSLMTEIKRNEKKNQFPTPISVINSAQNC